MSLSPPNGNSEQRDVIAEQVPVANVGSPIHLLIILSALMGFGAISTDFYLPAMPEMGRQFAVEPGTMEFTISGYLIGFSVGQLFWGPISDRYGRRLPLSIGLVLFILGSAGCALSGSATEMIIWRVLQALGACSGVVLARAMVRDIYQGPQAAQMLSNLIAVMAIAPLVGPILGGWISAIAGWPAIFWTMVAIGVVTLVSIFTIPETLPQEKRRTEPLFRSFLRYGELLCNGRLLAFIGAGGFFYAGMFAYIAGTPFAFITYYHVPAHSYGWLFGAGIVGIMGSNLINARLVKKRSSQSVLARGTMLALIAGLLIAAAAFTDFGGLWGLFIPLFVFAACTGFIVANSITGAMANFGAQAGAVSALIGALQYGSGVISSALVGAFSDGTPWPMGWVMAVCGLGSFLCVCLIRGVPRRLR